MRYTSKQAARELYEATFGCKVPVASWTEEKIRHLVRIGKPKATMTAKAVLVGKFTEAAGVAPAKSWTAKVIADKLEMGNLKAPKAAPSKTGSGETVAELRKWATAAGIKGRSKMNKAELLAEREKVRELLTGKTGYSKVA